MNLSENLKSLAKLEVKSELTSQCFIDIATECLSLLKSYEIVPCNSEVRGKYYFYFRKNGKKSRVVEENLFDKRLSQKDFKIFLKGKFVGFPSIQLNKILYTMVMSYSCVWDLKLDDKLISPGNYFQKFVSHLFARQFNNNPQSDPKIAKEANLPADCIFDLGMDKYHIHLPVKLSTRERAIQVWAHQRILDGVNGYGRYRGILVIMNETNFKAATSAVTEVCIPDQWKLYQMFIAQLYRVYYFDLPEKYSELSKMYPFIQVKSITDFFNELDLIIQAK